MSEWNREILRWVLLIGAAPIWWPFLRTLWRDFNAALAEEGGLFGRPPGPRERERLRLEREKAPATLTHEPWVRAGQRRKTRLAAPGRASRARPAAPGSARPSDATSGGPSSGGPRGPRFR
jgi:hypothetical protein